MFPRYFGHCLLARNFHLSLHNILHFYIGRSHTLCQCHCIFLFVRCSLRIMHFEPSLHPPIQLGRSLTQKKMSPPWSPLGLTDKYVCQGCVHAFQRWVCVCQLACMTLHHFTMANSHSRGKESLLLFNFVVCVYVWGTKTERWRTMNCSTTKLSLSPWSRELTMPVYLV